MAAQDELNKAKDAAKELNLEVNAINVAVKSLASELIEVVKNAEGFDAVTKRTANTFQQDLTKSLDNVKKNNEKILELQQKQLLDQKLNISEQKKLDVLLKRQASDRIKAENALNNLRGEGVNISVELEIKIQDQLDASEALGVSAKQLNTDLITQAGVVGNLVDTAKEYLLSLDKSGLAAELLNGNLNKAQKSALLGEAVLIAIAKATLEGSDNINNLQKNLGISYGNAYQLQNSLASTAASSEKLFITSKALNESFTALAETTGILSDFGGDTLVTMTALTKQLGLGVTEASQLALLARTQGTDTESVLENTVDTVNAVNRQREASISAKAVLNDIAKASASIVVSLGMSPELLAEAATEARALGTSLAQIDKIAGSLLNFETSIENELTFQMLTGKEINLDKARQLALDNDLAGLSEEIGNNAAITEAFATGNRIQQEAAAAALGMSRDSMAEMVMQQAFLNLGQDEFIKKYGEQSYLDMQAMSASDKFAASLEKIQGIIGDIGTIFAPIIDGFAALVGYLAASKPLLIAIATTMTVIAVQSAIAARARITEAVGSIFSSFGSIPFGLGVPLAFGAAAGLYAIANKSQTVADGIAPSSKGPFTITDSYGAMAVTTAGDSLMASPNVGKGGGSDGKMLALLERIANKDSNVYMDSSKVGTSMAIATSRI